MQVAIVARLLAATVFDHGRQISGAQNLVLEKDWPLNPVAHFLPPLCPVRRLLAGRFSPVLPSSSFTSPSSSTAFSVAFSSAAPGASTPTAPAPAAAAASGPRVNARTAVLNESD